MSSNRPLDQYRPKGYVKGVTDGLRADRGDVGEHNHSDEHRALDAAVYFTATNMSPPFTAGDMTDEEWWQPAYDAACKALESAIISALVVGSEEVADD